MIGGTISDEFDELENDFEFLMKAITMSFVMKNHQQVLQQKEVKSNLHATLR